MKVITLRKILLQVGYISVLIGTISTSGPMLFAANVNEFRNLAKQFVPNRLADHLVAIVSEASETQNKPYKKEEILKTDRPYEVETKKPLRSEQRPEDAEYVYYNDNDPDKTVTVSYDQIAGIAPNSKESYEYEYDDPKPKLRGETYSTVLDDWTTSEQHVFEIDTSDRPYNQQIKPLQVNLDQLVQKVKEKLLSDITKDPDLIKNIVVQQVSGNAERSGRLTTLSSTYTDWYERDIALNNSPEFGRNSGRTKRTRTTTPKSADIPVRLFKEFDLNIPKKEKDSYEDYIMPKREGNIFYSEEENSTTVHNKIKKFSPEPGKKYMMTRNTPRAMVSAIEYDDDNETITEPESFKARTETLEKLDYEAQVLNPNVNPNIRPDNNVPRKVKLVTMMPRREIFRITTPNYYGKLPTVAEKYDFNEPIPEKDREVEVLKPIGPEPVRINGKKLADVTVNKDG